MEHTEYLQLSHILVAMDATELNHVKHLNFKVRGNICSRAVWIASAVKRCMKTTGVSQGEN